MKSYCVAPTTDFVFPVEDAHFARLVETLGEDKGFVPELDADKKRTFAIHYTYACFRHITCENSFEVGKVIQLINALGAFSISDKRDFPYKARACTGT